MNKAEAENESLRSRFLEINEEFQGLRLQFEKAQFNCSIKEEEITNLRAQLVQKNFSLRYLEETN